MFVLGAAAGATGAYFYMKNKYETLIDEEVESVKEAFEKDLEERVEKIKKDLTQTYPDENPSPQTKHVPEEKDNEEIDKNDLNGLLAKKATNKPSPGDILKNKEGYKKEIIRYNECFKTDETDDNNFEAIIDKTLDPGITPSNPIVISPDEFGEDETYDKVSLYYYTDGIVADDNDEVVEDVDALIGYSSLETFGEYEDDAVHVKNEGVKTYYEILRCDKTFSGR